MTGALEPERPAWQRPPFEPGNLAAVRSGFWVTPTVRPDDRAEVEEIAASVREAMPIYRPGFELAIEQLACRLWRQRRAYTDLAENGIVRDGLPAPILADLSKLERAIARDLEAFGMTPRAQIALGVDLVRTEDALTQLEAEGRAIRERREANGG